MKINSTQNTYNRSTNFGAIPVADIKVKNNKTGEELQSVYKLYKLEESDRDFLEKLYETVDVRKMYPNLTENEHFIWDGSLKRAIETSLDERRTAYLETCDGIPCGIMNFTKEPLKKKNSYILDRIATFPIEKGKRVKYAGQILYHELYTQFLNDNKNNIFVVSPRHSPFSPIANYVRMGFNLMGGTEATENLRITKESVQKIHKKQQEFLTFDRFEKSESVDLDEHADLSVFEQ